MLPTDINHYTNVLRDLKTSLVSELSTLGIHNLDTDDWEARFDIEHSPEADESLLGDQAEAAEERIATLALLETRYRNVVRALDKIERGTYGTCEISGEAIESKRLAANPAARTCIAHMEEEDELPL